MYVSIEEEHAVLGKLIGKVDHAQEKERDEVKQESNITNYRDTTPSNDDNTSQIQVIICSCSAHLNARDIHITRVGPTSFSSSSSSSSSFQQLTSATLPLPTLQDLLTTFIPSSLSSFSQTYAQPHLALTNFQRFKVEEKIAHIQNLDLPSRAAKYVRNPLRMLGLAKRTRVGVQTLGVMSFRLFFNIAVVIIWLIIRRSAELFGLKLPPLALAAENEYSSEKERKTKYEARGSENDVRMEMNGNMNRKRVDDWIEIEQ